MKDYKRVILWLDYFNSAISRAQGRRVPLDKAIRDPTLEELSESVRRLGFHPESSPARHPLRMYLPSGFVSIEKRKEVTKGKTLMNIARTLSIIRGERAAAKEQQGKKGPQTKGKK